MITIEVIGMNHYMLSDYSHMHTKQIANLFETSENEIFFYSGDLKLFHDGVDQTSWHTLVRIHAPKKYEPFEKNVAKYLLDTLTDYILNAHIEFTYFDEHHSYEKLNHEYAPFFPREESDEEYVEEDYEEDEDFSDEELFEGNAFEGFEEKLKARQSESDEEKMCECGHQHVCCNGKSPACGKFCACGERCSNCHHAHDHECCEDDDCDCDCGCDHDHHHKH
ncbi:MAG: hypothetical protein J1F32_03245 [Erysipelotrichales bacterium]|nr:hypothetical protein [Erysipelotrichales bacterium]